MEIIEGIARVHKVYLPTTIGCSFEGIQVITTSHRYIVGISYVGNSNFGHVINNNEQEFIGADIQDVMAVNSELSWCQWRQLIRNYKDLDIREYDFVKGIRFVDFLTDRGTLQIGMYEDDKFWRDIVMMIDNKVEFVEKMPWR